jgi:hypothetical protein
LHWGTYDTSRDERFEYVSVKLDASFVYWVVFATFGDDTAPAERHSVRIDTWVLFSWLNMGSSQTGRGI